MVLAMVPALLVPASLVGSQVARGHYLSEGAARDLPVGLAATSLTVSVVASISGTVLAEPMRQFRWRSGTFFLDLSPQPLLVGVAVVPAALVEALEGAGVAQAVASWS